MKKLIPLIASLLLASCASMYNTGVQRVSLNGETGVEVKVKSPYSSYTTKLPATVALESTNQDVIVEVVDQRYHNTVTTVDKSLTPSFWANLFWAGGAIIGMAVDFSNGTLWKYNSANHIETWKRKETAGTHASYSSTSTARTSISPEEFEKSIPTRKLQPKKDNLVDPNQLPADWPQHFFYETADYKYWTVSGDFKEDQTSAMLSSKDKADSIVQAELLKEKYGTIFPETTHLEMVTVDNLFKSWRIVRVKRSSIK